MDPKDPQNPQVYNAKRFSYDSTGVNKPTATTKGGFLASGAKERSEEAALKHHLAVNRGDALCLGTAVHMLAASARSRLLNDKGFLYQDVSSGGARTTYVSEHFVLQHFAAVLQINVGELCGLPDDAGAVRSFIAVECTIPCCYSTIRDCALGCPLSLPFLV